MALAAEAAHLTEAHRLAQARLGAQTVLHMHTIWPLLDPTDLDGTVEQWLRAAQPLIQAQRSISARLAANYFTTFRAIELGVDIPAIVPTLAETVAAEKLSTSLLVTGPISIKSNMARNMALATATYIGEANSARAAMRHALGGGRDTLTKTIGLDREARGYQRVTSAKACAFCEMLAGRGGVYTADSGDFEAHDGCSCGVEPAY